MAQRKSAAPLVGVVMGSESDWDTLKHAAAQLDAFGVPYEARVLSAHRMPDDMFEYAEDAQTRGLRCIVAGAGGAAHLPGMLASKTTVPVLGVPVPSKYLRGEDSLLSIVQMPKGIPVATFAIGEAGAAGAQADLIALGSRPPAPRKRMNAIPPGSWLGLPGGPAFVQRRGAPGRIARDPLRGSTPGRIAGAAQTMNAGRSA